MSVCFFLHSLFLSLGVILRPLGVVESKVHMGDLAQGTETVFINAVICMHRDNFERLT